MSTWVFPSFYYVRELIWSIDVFLALAAQQQQQQRTQQLQLQSQFQQPQTNNRIDKSAILSLYNSPQPSNTNNGVGGFAGLDRSMSDSTSGLYQLQNQTSQTGFQQGAANFSASGTNGINQQQNQFGQFMQARSNNFSVQ